MLVRVHLEYDVQMDKPEGCPTRLVEEDLKADPAAFFEDAYAAGVRVSTEIMDDG